MKILLCHNHYQQPGGEDQVFNDEATLLEAHGHKVVRLTTHNDEVRDHGKLALAAKTFWNHSVYRHVRTLLRQERPAVVHCTNLFPLLSPAVYYACRAEKTPVVQSLHNYRLICPAAQLSRNGRICESCVGSVLPWRSIAHGCYRNDRAASAVVAGMSASHRLLGTWTKKVDRYIALTDFSRHKLIEGGLPADRIVVKQNFVSPDPGTGTGRGGFVLFAGRLSPEKGIDVLLGAWRRMSSPVPLRIAGDGPLADRVRDAAAADPRIIWLGRQTPLDILRLMGEAALLAMPSIWYEGCPKTLIEAMAVGTPIVASGHGAMAEMITDDKNGWLFEPGNATSLASLIERLMARPSELASHRLLARHEYLARYTASQNYRQLMDIYAALGAVALEQIHEPPTMAEKLVTN